MYNSKQQLVLGAVIGAVLAVVIVLLGGVYVAKGATCSDPVAYNYPLVWRSLSGVEVDWQYGVKSGCTSTFRVQILRQDTRNPDDPFMRSHYQSPKYTFGQGDYVTNALVTTPQQVIAVLWVGGKVYNTAIVDPSAIP